jgi:hypothetical protein
MFLLYVPFVIITLGLGILFFHPLCALWGALAADAHNRNLVGVGSLPQAASVVPAAGWHTDPEGSGKWRYWDGTNWTQHYTTPSAGWHADPSGSGHPRYWDGTAWTDHYA